MNLLEIATAYAESFETRKRGIGDTGESYIAHGENAPEWARAITFTAHGNGDYLPEDYRYRFAYNAASALAYFLGDNPEGDPDEAREYLSPDVYNSDLLQWVSSNLRRASYVDEAVQEYGFPDSGFFQALMIGQLAEREEVFSLVLAGLQEVAEEEGEQV